MTGIDIRILPFRKISGFIFHKLLRDACHAAAFDVQFDVVLKERDAVQDQLGQTGEFGGLRFLPESFSEHSGNLIAGHSRLAVHEKST